MRKWIFLTVLLLAGAAAAYLDHTGKIDLRAAYQTAVHHVGEWTKDLTEDEAQAATGKNSRSPAGKTLAPAVSVAAATTEQFVDEILVTGSLIAREQILIAPEVEGLRVVALAAEEGDTVAEGQILATLERETLLSKKAQIDANLRMAVASIDQARSRVKEAQAVLEEAEAQLARAEPLKNRKFLSESVFDQRQTAASTSLAKLGTAKDGVVLAEAEKAQIEAQLREVDWSLSKTEIRAPAAGLITRRNVRIGDLASGTKSPMFVLARDGEIELEAKVIEPKLARMAPGQNAVVEVAGAGEVNGKVRLVSPEIDRMTRLGSVRVFLGTGTNLRIGAFGRATVVAAKSQGLSLPLSAILFQAGKAYVQKIHDGKVTTSPVTLGLTGDGVVEITGGLAEGDLVVAKAGSFLRDGDLVRPVYQQTRLSEAH